MDELVVEAPPLDIELRSRRRQLALPLVQSAGKDEPDAGGADDETEDKCKSDHGSDER